MKVTGSEFIPTPRAELWRLLLDPGVLQQAIPGCQSFEPRGDDTYDATLVVGIGPIRGRFSGTLRIQDQREPEGYAMVLEGQGPIGFVRGQGQLTLTEEGEGTRLQVEGEAQVGGTLVQVGSRMLETATRLLMGQFFSSIAAQARRAP